MNFFKRFFCLALCAVMTLCLSLNVYAIEPYRGETKNRNIFVFETPTTRMDEKGNFHFSIKNEVHSAHFKANKSELTVKVSAWMRDEDRFSDYYDPFWPPTDSSKEISITLYKWVDRHATDMGSFTIKATDETVTQKFSDVEIGVEYYLLITLKSSLEKGMIVDGKGNVSDVTVINPS